MAPSLGSLVLSKQERTEEQLSVLQGFTCIRVCGLFHIPFKREISLFLLVSNLRAQPSCPRLEGVEGADSAPPGFAKADRAHSICASHCVWGLLGQAAKLLSE